MKKVLICANPDLNLIDGSSVWSQTFALALAETGMAQVDFIARTQPQTDHLFAPLLNHKAINIVTAEHGKRLPFDEMARMAAQRDAQEGYDVILIRGKEIALNLLNYDASFTKAWIYLTDIEQDFDAIDDAEKAQLSLVAQKSARILCQSQGFIDLWRRIAPNIPESHYSLYTPVTYDPDINPPAIATRPKQAVYAGKFKREWKTLDMTQQWQAVLERLPTAKLLMIGDKIHNDADMPDYKEAMTQALQNTSGVDWLGAMSRADVHQHYLQARVGLSWRDAAMDDTIEYSTKILEYGAAGCAVVLNRNALHEGLMGKDYPLFANTKGEFVEATIKALRDTETAQNAADIMYRIAQAHSFSSRVEQIKDWLNKTAAPAVAASPVIPSPSPKSNSRKKTVLVAGHDFKFFTPLQEALKETGEFDFLIDKWQSHNRHNEEQSRDLLAKADVIMCEWCLGNLAWYSQNKLPHQKLVARLHLQERKSPHLQKIDFTKVDHIVYVSPFMTDTLKGQKGTKDLAVSSISNYIDTSRFKPRKKFGDAAFTLGIIGITPERKRLDRAIDLLEKLLETDPRYRLRIKGKIPLDYDWMENRPEELAYYENLMERINSNPKLRYKVLFDPAGDDVDEWLSLIGFILSPSDFESFHMAIGEGMLAGCCPVIWNWEGAETLWPEEYIINEIDEAAALILSKQDIDWVEKGKKWRNYVLTRHSEESVINAWRTLLLA